MPGHQRHCRLQKKENIQQVSTLLPQTFGDQSVKQIHFSRRSCPKEAWRWWAHERSHGRWVESCIQVLHFYPNSDVIHVTYLLPKVSLSCIDKVAMITLLIDMVDSTQLIWTSMKKDTLIFIRTQPKINFKPCQSPTVVMVWNQQAFWCWRRGLYSSRDIPGWLIF